MNTRRNIRLIAKLARLLEQQQGGKLSQRSEERFRALIENSSDLITILGADGTLKYESPSVTSILGYQPDELVGKNGFDFIHTDDAARVREDFERTFVRGEPGQKIVHRFRHRNNSWRVFESIGKTFVDESGELVGVVNSRDITERRRLDRAVKFRTHLLDVVEQAIVATDLGGNITYWNEFAVRLYGWAAAEVAGHNILEVTPAQTTREQASEIMNRLREGLSWSGEFLMQRKDGTVFPAMVTDSPIYDDERTLVGIVGISFDITERKRAEEELRQSERQLAEAQNLARVGSWNWDMLNDIVTWTDQIYRIYGLTPQEFTPTRQHFLASLHPDDREYVLGVIDNSLRTREPFSYHYRIVRPDGGVRIIHSNRNVASDEHGNLLRSFGTMQDVTERVEAEEQLKISNEKLRALSARLQSVREEDSIRIAREIHDELGGALTGLKMDLSSLGKRLPASGNEAAHQQLKAMAKFIDETIQKVRQIATELRPSMLDDLGLAAAIEWQAGEFQRRTEIKCKIISLQEDVVLSPEKSTAVFRIYQEILTNIARHAQATSVEIRMEQPDGELILRVSDNGRGIKESEMAGTKSLGLLGMRERALIFGGQIEIAGAKGRGTTVTVRIPGA